jgi:hypothetical protein
MAQKLMMVDGVEGCKRARCVLRGLVNDDDWPWGPKVGDGVGVKRVVGEMGVLEVLVLRIGFGIVGFRVRVRVVGVSGGVGRVAGVMVRMGARKVGIGL